LANIGNDGQSAFVASGIALTTSWLLFSIELPGFLLRRNAGTAQKQESGSEEGYNRPSKDLWQTRSIASPD
jgi:hypothetical protein